VSVALFGHGEIERAKRDPVHWHFALGKYDRILAGKVVEPLRELAMLRKAQTLAAVGKRDAALATLVELDPRGKLGRCDASMRPLIAPLLLGLVDVDSAPLPSAAACGDALEIAERLADPTALDVVGRRCNSPPAGGESGTHSPRPPDKRPRSGRLDSDPARRNSNVLCLSTRTSGSSRRDEDVFHRPGRRVDAWPQASSPLPLLPGRASGEAASHDDAHEHGNDGQHEQHVNEATSRHVKRKAERPHEDEKVSAA
jgi:hypothetical protein